MELLENYSLKSHNTFGIDAKARLFAEAESENDFLKITTNKRTIKLEKLLLGGGSNILFTSDYNGLVIKNSIKGIEVTKEDDDYVWIRAGGGENWDDLVSYCVEKNYGGIENLSLIPGSVGAAPIQNIGAYGAELVDVFYSLEGIFLETGERKIYYKKDCEFSYRNSIFKTKLKNKIFITRLTLQLRKNPALNLEYESLKQALQNSKKANLTIRDVSELVKGIRRSKLPDVNKIGNAGSFFKNPELDHSEFINIKEAYPDVVHFKTEDKIKVSAGWLIEQCGWKGKRQGNTGTYDKQALVLINYCNASGKEIKEFADVIQNSVHEKFKIKLEPEVNII